MRVKLIVRSSSSSMANANGPSDYWLQITLSETQYVSCFC